MLVSVFRNFTEVVEDIPLLEVFDRIRSDKYAQQVNQLRQFLEMGDLDSYDHEKRSLLAFTPSATFKNGRKNELLAQYSGVVHLDFDKIPADQVETFFYKVCGIPHTLACFHSPSINGLKVFVKVNSGADFHPIAYKQVQDYYETKTGFLCDPKCKDITRLCFVSYDKALYLNLSSQTFIVMAGQVSLSSKGPDSSITSHFKAFEECVEFTGRKLQYLNGNRNNFIYQLASNCNRSGIPESIATGYISEKYDLDYREILNSVKSAYTHHADEFGKFAKSANHSNYTETPSQRENIQPFQGDPEIDYLKNTPLIPEDVYSQLPPLLSESTHVFTDHRERDVFLTGALAILSGCLPGVKGTYAQQTVYPNLFAFIVAPAASGKGALKFAKDLADTYHKSTLSASREETKRYKAQENAYKAKMRTNTDQESYEEPPVKPPFRVVFIPANSSYAKLLLHLQDNEGEGIICETEADTMGNVLKHDWGNYSDMLRKAFHHERISSSKKTNDEFIEVNTPKLSVAISGTPSQVTGLIASSEDGLFSRFLFYAFKAEQLWRDVSPGTANINLTDYFGQLSNQVFELVSYLEESPSVIELTCSQWHDLNSTCSEWLKEITLFNGDETGSIVKRLGIILYRLCMVYTAMRKVENGDDSLVVTCTDPDYRSAKSLVNIFLQHSLLMFHNLPKQADNRTFNAGDRKQAFLAALPLEFKRADAIEIGKLFKYSPRSVDNLLKKLLQSHLSQPQFGIYSKI